MRAGLWVRSAVLFAAVSCVLVYPAALHAQAGYLTIVRSYFEDNASAASQMAKLSRAAIEAGVRACLGKDRGGLASCRPNELKSAAILHADALDFLVRPDPSLAAFHVESGSRMLRPLEKVDAVFVARWYAYVARIYLANRDVATARSLVAEGLGRFESADLYLARGVITERQALARMPDVLGAMLEHRLNEGTIPNTLAQAIVDYLKALAIDPGHTGARLRLAWIRLLQRDRRATDDAAGVLRASTDPEARYLALLFRGAIAERDRSLAEAIHEYEEARLEDVDTQTACVTLSHAHGLAGNVAQSAAAAAECLARVIAADDMDPWWPFRVGLMDLTTTKWLHDHAVQP